ncbi:pyridoxamine 5'-phosphate oxidase family protein [Neptunomonas phycophila]|uniref:pyridoxamine 5'-phosphate oxidase family protein n=1 Tax=Neptunomonas phycophila TaxID=1572645 RepID=UPI0015BBA4E9|nr:pyridoxamine 5'-phosphate oxidase family protein [Neptunomonas phycophila]QLE98797.1 pyridoxamine 5'-phosphate oxidase family protein [Neptunomonas phycophila]
MESYSVKPHTRVKRGGNRATYDKAVIDAILDEATMCHVGGVVDGLPVVQPNLHWRVDDVLYIHGSVKNGLIRSILEQGKVCITVSILDGLVMARSAFHHSVNYRSVMLFGTPELVEDEAEKKRVLDALLEKTHKGRSLTARPPNTNELRATTVIGVRIEEVSAKVRAGAPIDDAEDHALPVWAGVIPVSSVRGEPIQDALQQEAGIEVGELV